MGFSSVAGDLLWAWLVATALSGLPSTIHALITGTDVTESMRAAGAMLISRHSSFSHLFAAAMIVHATVSFAWAAILILALPRRRTLFWALIASVLIAVLDLSVVAPLMFPEVASLPFWPQLADHLMWGASVGTTLQWRWGRRGVNTRRSSEGSNADPSA
jgi:hypothetical protein